MNTKKAPAIEVDEESTSIAGALTLSPCMFYDQVPQKVR